MVKTVVCGYRRVSFAQYSVVCIENCDSDSGREKRIRKIQIQKPLSVSTQRGFYHGVLRPE